MGLDGDSFWGVKLSPEDMRKDCTKCGSAKAPEEFYASKSGKNGRASQCKSCYYEANKAWTKANPERSREIKAKWQAANPESIAAKNRRRRGVKFCNGPHYTAADVARLLIEQRGRCAYCLLELDESYHVDHIVPLSRGGSDGVENICLTCPSCNCSKGNRLLCLEWIPLSIGISLSYC